MKDLTYALKDLLLVDGKPNLLFKIILSVIVLIVSKLVSTIVSKILKKIISRYNRFNEDNKKVNSVFSIMTNIIKYIIYFVGILIILNIFGVNTASLIATAGVGGIIIAFGVQSVVKDLFNGVFILVDDQYNIGDDVVINGIEGSVMAINIRNTIIRGYDGSINTVSHGSINTVTNKSKGSQRTVVDIYVPIDTDMDKVKKIISKYSDEFAKNTVSVVDSPRFLGVTGTGTHYLKASICFWSKQSKQWENERKYREGILETLKKENITFLKFDLKGETNV